MKLYQALIVATFWFQFAIGGQAQDEHDESGRIEILRPLLRHPDRVELGFPVAGRLGKIDFEEGTVVEAGQILAILDNAQEQAQAELQQARANSEEAIQTARVRVNAAKEALDSAEEANTILARAIPAQEVRRLKLDLELAQAELSEKVHEQKLAALEYKVSQVAYEATFLRAPFAGTITRRYLSVGAPVDGLKPIAQMVDTSHLRLEGLVTQSAAKRIKVGDVIVLQQPNGSEKRLRVGFIDVGAQQVQKQVRIWGQLKTPGDLMEGEAVTAHVVVNKKSENL